MAISRWSRGNADQVQQLSSSESEAAFVDNQNESDVDLTEQGRDIGKEPRLKCRFSEILLGLRDLIVVY